MYAQLLVRNVMFCRFLSAGWPVLERHVGMNLRVHSWRWMHHGSTYSELATKAADTCGKEVEGKSLALFKPYASVVIPDGEILVNRALKPWSLGAYLARLRKAAGSIKFGVGIVKPG